MAETVDVFFLAGGLGASAAFLLALSFGGSVRRLLAVASLGVLLFAALQLSFADVGDPLVRGLIEAAGSANALGWLAGTTLAARVRFRALDLEKAA